MTEEKRPLLVRSFLLSNVLDEMDLVSGGGNYRNNKMIAIMCKAVVGIKHKYVSLQKSCI